MKIKHFSLLAVCLLAATGLMAQDTALVTDIVATPNYFVTVLFGVMLAIGFQFALTALSIAVGVSAIPNLKKTYVETKYSTDSKDNDRDWNETKDSTDTGVVISSALGVWNVITAALSLFGATALALTLTPVVTTPIAITLGLSIWAVFYLLMFYLEGKMVGTMIGSLINTAVAGLRAGAETVKAAFTPSPAGQVEKVADHTIEKLRKEMSATFDTDAIADSIDKFTAKVDKVGSNVGDKLDKKLPSYEKLRKDLENLVKQSNNGQSDPAKWTAIQSAIQTVVDKSGEGDNGGDGSKQQKIEQLKGLYEEYKDQIPGLQKVVEGGNAKIARNEDGSVDKEATIKQLTDYLQNATPDSFDVEKLSSQIQNFAQDPKGNAQGILQTIQSVDKDTIVQAITANTNLDKEQINSYTDRVTEVIAGLKSKLPIGGGSGGNSNGQSDPGFVQKVRAAITGFIDSTDDPRLNSRDLERDFQRIMNNPNESLDVISRRLDTYDRDTLVSLLTNNSKLSRADIDHYVARVEKTRNQIKDQIQSIKDTANSTVNQASRRAVIQADGARKAAVAASWWLFAAIVVSAGAAILGATTGAF